MDVTFHNVTITITAKTPQAAYAELADLFSVKQRLDEDTLEYTTDTYSLDREPYVPHELRSTRELWPDNDHERGEKTPAEKALADIASEMDAKEWDTDTLEKIADHLRRAGFTLREPYEDEED